MENPMLSRFAAVAIAVAFAMPAWAADQVEKAPPTGAYKKVSELVKLPDFLPGLGQLFVDPKTLPAGPFLAYDREGKLVSTVYMLPVDDLTNKDKRFDDLAAPGGKVDHVDVYFNAGHPGVEKPHAHVILWHVPKADETRVAAKWCRRAGMFCGSAGVSSPASPPFGFPSPRSPQRSGCGA